MLLNPHPDNSKEFEIFLHMYDGHPGTYEGNFRYSI